MTSVDTDNSTADSLDTDSTPAFVYEVLRRRIISGTLTAGSELAQARVAEEFGVSRGPVREAFRLLQREGLIVTAVNLRARVSDLSAEEVDHLYALRVVNEALALRVSIPCFTDEELNHLQELAVEIAGSKPDNFDAWEQLHEQFHNLLVSHCGPSLSASLTLWSDFTERYRRVYVADRSGGWLLGSKEHLLLAQECSDRNADAAVTILARHLGRAGLMLVEKIDAEYKPVLINAAMSQVIPHPSRPHRLT